MAEEKKSKGGKVGKAEAKGARGGANVTFDVINERPKSLGKKTRYASHWEQKALPELMKKFGYTSVMQAPRFVKIVLNMGVGDATVDVKNMDIAVNELAQIAGQRPSVRKAKKAISNFKLRAGQPIGCAVTLRGHRMYEFFDRLVSVAIPRIRDFRGLPQRSFDGRGNYTFGVQEQIIFPEINYDKVDKVRGMDITFVTSARTDEEALELLKLMKFPFREK